MFRANYTDNDFEYILDIHVLKYAIAEKILKRKYIFTNSLSYYTKYAT